jgi:peptidyl-tRNA hydrolase, PTH2 family
MKMVIVMRTDLNMRKGKMCAQAAHAAVMATTKLGVTKEKAVIIEWLKDGQKKIVIGVPSFEDLEDLRVKAWQSGISFTVVTDAGHTEFHGKPTVTCMALGPDTDENLDPVTGDLKLL